MKAALGVEKLNNTLWSSKIVQMFTYRTSNDDNLMNVPLAIVVISLYDNHLTK